MMNIHWAIKFFTELSPAELYAIIRLRNEVFVVEQHCVFQDADNHDETSHHLCGWQNEKLAAYARIIPPGKIYNNPSIGRVVTAPFARKQNLGKALMEKAIEYTNTTYGMDITIGAQLYLRKFYESLGFVKTSDVYLEDGIEHIQMDFKI